MERGVHHLLDVSQDIYSLALTLSEYLETASTPNESKPDGWA